MDPIFANCRASVFEVASRLAGEREGNGPGEGFPDDPGPAGAGPEAAEAVVPGWSGDPPMTGLWEPSADAIGAQGRFCFANADSAPDRARRPIRADGVS